VFHKPFSEIFTDEIRELALIMQDELKKSITLILSFNAENVISTPSIDGWLGFKNKVLVERHGFRPVEMLKQPAY
jgi:hypothetical protein